MKRLRKAGWVAMALALAVAGSRTPRFLHADTAANSQAVSDQRALADLAALAVNTDPAVAKSAIDKLRAAGPAGLDALLAANQSEIASHRSPSVIVFGKEDTLWPRVTDAIDSVAAQHDAYASGLYWYTDMAAAQSAAKAAGKPILSLRLLGNLSDEYSCANSRFFRTVLYANAEVSKHLRENYILHWQSVRPIPVITIDFGDGRTIRRTITGNSIHYVLNADGKVLDAIPGLYGPKAFLNELAVVESEFPAVANASPTNRAASLMRWHADQASRIEADFEKDRSSINVASSFEIGRPRTLGSSTISITTQPASGTYTLTAVPATVAGQFAISKVTVERPLVAAVQPSAPAIVTRQLVPGSPTTADQLSDADWLRIAALHTDDATLDQSSRALMESKTVDAATAARRTMSKFRVEDPLVKMVENFQRSIAEDTVRNEYLFHLQIHRWLTDPATANLADDVNALNKRVYAELFLTPDSDPWLGLVPPDTYTALNEGGLCTLPKH